MRLVYGCIAWLAGIHVAAQWPFLGLRFWLGLIVAWGVLIWVMRSSRVGRAASILLLVMCMGALRIHLVDSSSSLAMYHGRTVALTGIVAAPPDTTEDRSQLRLSVTSVFDGSVTQTVEGVALVVAPSVAGVRYGDIISAAGILSEPGDYDAFSYTDYLARQGIHSLMRNATVTMVEASTGQDITTTLISLRSAAQNAIFMALPQPQAGLLTGILLGNERTIASAVKDDFSVTGLSHIIAISGFNMAILSGAVLVLLRPVTERRPAATVMIAIGVLAAYAVLVEGGASVTRSALMCSVLLLAPLFRRRAYLPATLAAAAIVLTAVDPFSVWDVGFQLSFAAVLGLTILLPPLQRATADVTERWLRSSAARSLALTFSDLLGVTLIAQIATLPLLMLTFQQVSVVSLIVNVLVLPVQAAVLVYGLIALSVSLMIPALGQVLFALEYVLLSWTIGIVQAFAALPQAAQAVYVSPFWVALFYGGLVGGHILNHVDRHWMKRLRQIPLRRGTVAGAACFLGLVMLVLSQRPDGRLHIHWLDMGRSSAVLIQTPGGAQILMDGGRYPTRLMTSLGSSMAFNDREIDMLILTQPDDADNSALLEVLRYYSVGLVVSNGQPNASEVQGEIAALLADVPQVVATTGTTLHTDDGVMLEVLNPNEQPSLTTPLPAAGLVLRLTYGERSFLLAGNVDASALLTNEQNLVSDVVHMAAPNSGRRSDMMLLEAAEPSLVVVQLDRVSNNRYALDELVATFEMPELLRTDRDGAIHLISDGVRVWHQPAGR